MSSWEYPSFNRASELSRREHHRVGEFERLPSRIERRRFEDSQDKRQVRDDGSRDRSIPRGGRFKPILEDLPLPRPGLYGEQSQSSWDRVPSSSSSASKNLDPGRANGSSSSDVVVVDLADDEEESHLKEELFPPNKVALLQSKLEDVSTGLVGMEYIIEVQQSGPPASVGAAAPLYYCLLCGEKTKTCETTSASQELIKNHLESLHHKSTYIEYFFPTLKKCILNKIPGSSKSNGTYREALSRICSKISATYGKMNIKIVVGLQLFERRQEEIKKMIDNSTHFRENKGFVDSVLKESRNLADSYEKVFSDFEAELRKKNSRDRHRSYDSSRDYKGRSRDRYRSRRGSRSRSPRTHGEERKASSRNSFDWDSISSSSDHDRKQRVISPSAEHEVPKKSAFIDILAKGKSHDNRERISSERSFPKGRKFPAGPESGPRFRLLSKSVERNIERYLDKEKSLNDRLHQERQEYLNFPHTHRQYNEEWEKFYVGITTTRGISDSDVINQEWIGHWKAFFFESFDLEARQRRDQLMVDHHITSRDLDEYYKYKTKSLEEQVESKLSSHHRDRRPSSSLSRSSSSSALKKVEDVDDKEVTVISTFRLLSALENILDELGPTVIRLLAKANSIEVNEGFGSSSAMIHEEEVFALLWKAKEKLDYKISNDIIDGSQVPASKVCISNISCLIKKSKCERPLEPPNPTLSNEISIRAGIAKTVVEQFDAEGKIITESQLARIVEMEYARVKDSVPSSSAALPQASSPNAQSPSKSPIVLANFNKKPEKEEEAAPPTPKSEEDLENMTCQQLAHIFKRFRDFNKLTRCMILDYMKKIEKTNPARVTEMKKIIHSKN